MTGKRAQTVAHALVAIGILVGVVVAWLGWTQRPTASDLPDGLNSDGVVGSAEQRPAVVVSGEPNRAAAPVEPGQSALRLRRYPDGAVLAGVSVRVAVDGEDSWRITDSGGVLLVPLSQDGPLTIDVAGFATRQLAGSNPTSRDIDLVPLFGVFGRVLNADGSPGADVAVSAESRTRSARVGAASGGRVPLINTAVVLASANTNQAGYYYLNCETRSSGPALKVIARSPSGQSDSEIVLTPRAAEPLRDLRLSPARKLRVQVVDEKEMPVAKATVFTPERGWSSPLGETNANGICEILEPPLPTVIDARFRGRTRKAVRHNGAAVDPMTLVTSVDVAVQVQLADQTGVVIRVVDAETRAPVATMERSRVELYRRGERIVGTSVLFDDHGEGWLPIGMDERGTALAEPADSGILWPFTSGYTLEPQDLSFSSARGDAPIEVALNPHPDAEWLRGVVVRSGRPVSGVALGLKVQNGTISDVSGLGEHVRGSSDSAGRFNFRFRMANVGDQVVVYPHWKRWDEYGFVGPLKREDVHAGEHVLELKAARPVPVLLKNVSRSQAYRYFVHLEAGASFILTTVNGAPVHIETDGEARTTFMLPSDVRASITVGYASDEFSQAMGSNRVSYDPALLDGPLVFELEPRFGRISGSVVGMKSQQGSATMVAYRQGGSGVARVCDVGIDGKFAFDGVLLGGGTLLLLESVDGRQAIVLAKLAIEVDGVMHGVQLFAGDSPPTVGR